MITQELVQFIKAQLQEGKSKEQIAGILTPHGWQLEDINQVFAQIMPTAQPVAPVVQPVAQPVIAQPSVTPPSLAAVATPPLKGEAATAMMGSVMQPQGFMDSFKHPTTMFATATLVISAIVSSLLYYVAISHSSVAALAATSQNALVGGLLGIMLVSVLLGSVIVTIVARILRILDRSFAKAVVFTGTTLVLSSVTSLLRLASVPAAVTVALSVMVWAFMFAYFYSSGIWKTVAAFLLNGIVAAVLGLVVFLAAGAIGFSAVSLMSHHGAAPTLAPMTIPVQVIPPAGSPAVLPATTPQSGSQPSPDSSPSQGGPAAAAQAQAFPDLSHVEAALPVGYPTPADGEVVSASVASATDLEGIRYILDYTSSHSAAYVRNALKAALTAGGYTLSLNESNSDYQVITGSHVAGSTSTSIAVDIQSTAVGSSIHTVLTE